MLFPAHPLGQLQTSRPTDLLGKVVQQGVEAFEAALVDGHPDAPEPAVAAFVEGDPLGRGHTGGGARVGGGPRGEGRGMFRRGMGVPHLCEDRMHAATSRTPGRNTHTHTHYICSQKIHFTLQFRAAESPVCRSHRYQATRRRRPEQKGRPRNIRMACQKTIS